MASQWGHRARALRPPELVSWAEHCPPQTALGPDAAGRFDTELEGMRPGAGIRAARCSVWFEEGPPCFGGDPELSITVELPESLLTPHPTLSPDALLLPGLPVG